MKKHRDSYNPNVVIIKKNSGNESLTAWIWPYLIVPACVAALLAVFFFMVCPPLRHWIGIKNIYGVAFWLTALGLWILATTACTILWLFAGRNLVKSEYYMIANSEVEHSQANVRSKINNTCNETNKHTHEQSNWENSEVPFRGHQVIQQYPASSGSAPLYSDIPVTIQMEELPTEKYSQSEIHIVNINTPQASCSSVDDDFLIPESQKSHPPRRVSYAGVISVDLPPSEIIDEKQDCSKLFPPRPPTPRFPRGMRVGSNESSISQQLTDLSLNHMQPKTSTSDSPQGSKLIQLELLKEQVQIEEAQIEQTNIEQECFATTPSEKSDPLYLSKSDIDLINVNKSDSLSVSDRKHNDRETREIKKVHLNDEFEQVNEKDRSKRMSMDRNQFLGWNPDEGVLAEADPGSKEREENRWRRSLGAWHASTSIAWDAGFPGEIGGAEDEEELDDVFQEVENVPKRQSQCMHNSETVKMRQ